MIRRLSEREKIILFITVGVVAFSVVYNKLMEPLLLKKDLLDAKIISAREELALDKKIVENSMAITRRYDDYVKEFGRVGTQEETASKILSEIEQMARKLDLQVMDLKPGSVKQGKEDEQFSVTLTINSELVTVVQFLYLLQQKPHWFDVQELEFEKFMRGDELMITTRLVLSKAFIPLTAETGIEDEPGL